MTFAQKRPARALKCQAPAVNTNAPIVEKKCFCAPSRNTSFLVATSHLNNVRSFNKDVLSANKSKQPYEHQQPPPISHTLLHPPLLRPSVLIVD